MLRTVVSRIPACRTSSAEALSAPVLLTRTLSKPALLQPVLLKPVLPKPVLPKPVLLKPALLIFSATVALSILVPAALGAQPSLSPEHEAIDFLAGEWRTSSELPDGRVAEGDLRYEWVLGGGWMRITFIGEPPDGGVWETHAMQRWDPEEGRYESLVFWDGGPPVRYTGTVPGPGRYRIRGTSDEGVAIGIDYRATDDGGVYQENWAMSEGERRVTLRTTYRRVGG